ncbi:MAG: hypothetical protein IKS90_05055 [Clostridia bacterium]|nr:hypothetical protein [Clostridia bacterium]
MKRLITLLLLVAMTAALVFAAQSSVGHSGNTGETVPVINTPDLPIVDFNGRKYYSISANNGCRLLITLSANEVERQLCDTLAKYLFDGVHYPVATAMTAIVTDTVYVSDKKAFFLGFVPRRDPVNYARKDYTVFSLVFDKNEWFVSDCTEFDHSAQVFERIVSETRALRRINHTDMALIKERVAAAAAERIAPLIDASITGDDIAATIYLKSDYTRSDKVLAALMLEKLDCDYIASDGLRMYSSPSDLLRINILFIKLNPLKGFSPSYNEINKALFDPEKERVYPFAVSYFVSDGSFEFDYLAENYSEMFVVAGNR